jgi:hypothetical protein
MSMSHVGGEIVQLVQKFIVTHNVRDFRRVEELNVQAIAPADFLNRLRSPT